MHAKTDSLEYFQRTVRATFYACNICLSLNMTDSGCGPVSGQAGVGQFDRHPAAVRFNNQELFGDWGQTTHFMPQLLLNIRLTASCGRENYACIAKKLLKLP